MMVIPIPKLLTLRPITCAVEDFLCSLALDKHKHVDELVLHLATNCSILFMCWST